MPQRNDTDKTYPFLRGSGEMNEFIRSFDWSNTPLGPIKDWSSVLKFSVGMMLASTFPAAIYWGKHHTQLFNDPYRPVIGQDQYIKILGTSASEHGNKDGEAAKAIFDSVLAGESIELKDIQVESLWDGQRQTLYYDISYSPISDEDGSVVGVMAIWAETTPKVRAVNDLRAYKENISLVIRQSPVGICIVNADTRNITEVNDTFLQVTGQDRNTFSLGQPLGSVYAGLVEDVILSGQEYRALEQQMAVELEGVKKTTYVDFVYEPVRNRERKVVAVVIIANEVTDKIEAREQLQNINEELATTTEEIAASNEELTATNDDLMHAQEALQDSLKRLTDSEQEIRAIIENAPFPIAVYSGREMKIVHANQAVIDVWGKGSGIIGKTYYEILPELEAQDVYGRLDNVFTSGIAYHSKNERIILDINGTPQEFYFNYSFTPLRDAEGEVYGVMNTAADVTDLSLAKLKLERSESNFRNIILQAPVAMCLLSGPQHVVEVANGAMLEIWGKPKESVMQKPIFDALPDAREQGLEEVMQQVFLTGETYTANELPVSLIRHGRPDIVYQNFAYHAYHSPEGAILGVFAISVDVTEQVKSRHELEHALEQARLSKEAAELGTFDMSLADSTLQWDERCRELFGVSHDGEVTYERDFLGGLHPDDRQRIIDAIAATFDRERSGGNYDVEYRTVSFSDSRERWVRAKGKAYFDAKGTPVRFVGSVLDITEQKLHEIRLQELAEKQGRLAAIVNSSDDAIVSKNLEGIIASWNPAAERLFGYSQQEAIGRHISLIIPQDRLSEEDYIISRIREGKQVEHFDTIRIDKDGREKQLSISISPIRDASGAVIGASKIARDISQQNAAKAAVERYTSRLEILNTMIGAVSEELDFNKILQKVTDATTALTGAAFGAFFYNKEDEHGDSYLLYTLSGAPREAFGNFAMPRNTAVFHPTFSGQGPVRVADITKDPRYGKNHPHYGMPEGHLPVVSYLAVPVVSRSGKVIGGLFFGHPKPGMFTEEHETLVVSIAAQAAIGMDNAKLYEEVKILNDKKDEFIGLASHELKTPLTSVSGYLQIISRLQDPVQISKFLDKASLQVLKLTTLVNDLLDVSKIEAGKLKFSIAEFNLIETIQDAIELVRQGTSRHTIIFEPGMEECPVTGDSQRVEQVLLNLLNNAVKYSPGADTVKVDVICQDQLVRVGITDFGLGIPEDKRINIFSRFYRIEEATPNISGLGIGLYLSHEIISRHNGRIWVESELGEGSTFWFELPR